MKFLRRFQRTKVEILFFTVLLIGFGTPTVFAKEDLQPILAKIRENSRMSISSFKGIDYKRNLTITEIDSSTGKEISVSKVLTRRVEYYYDRPVVVVLNYVKNGVTLPPKDYEPEKSSPTYPIFDDQSDEHYLFNISGPVFFQNRQSYVVEISPLQLSTRHFKGRIYYEKNSLHPFYVEGTTSKLKFGVKEMYFKIFMEVSKEKVAIVRSGEVFVKTYIPFLLPEKDIRIQIETIDAVPIRK
ncbi:hypothetical protein EHQ05_03820 [Leptospira yasudae]|uniref:hypothetical protein n=1 Tax=Leptospira yasudae TaxID=2202201 RepID=UPI0010846FA1|nr:hypothetical protein [Leptospira yasudae]TGK30098.1 hypothetical protein EHQ05_03820 [Leptospira yasudae]TGM04521.1 hypothetical protein EHQ86_14915 [Leptospira yasudae]